MLWCGAAADPSSSCRSIIPETKGISLEEMDVIFGAVSSEAREAFIRKEERALGDVHDVSSQSDDIKV